MSAPKNTSWKNAGTLARNMTDEVVACRTLLHAWQPDTAFKVRGGYEIGYRCSRKCGSTRLDFVSLKGEVLARSYVYADDYRIEGLGRAPAGTRDAFRLESITRLAPGDKPEQA